jgi:hypothetical protein
MANRRMFSLRVINSARFLKMPISSQALYFHLGLNADDDGVVEAYNVIKTCGCTEDDLRVLVSKGFVQVLNEDLVSYITDWNENNKIRADRKIDSIYKDLLISVNPDVVLIEKKQRADVKRTTNGQPMDNQWTANGRHRIGKDRLGKDRIGEDSIGKVREEIDYQLIADMYNDTCVSFPRLTTLSDARKKAIKARLKVYSVEDFQRLFDKAEGSTFLKGGNDRNWSATFDWLIKDTNMAKVLDGNYDNKSKPQQAIPARRNDKAQELDDFYKMVADWADGSGGDST